MTEYFSFIVTLFSLIQIVLIIVLNKFTYALFSLYRNKKNPDYPILLGEATEYLYKSPKSFFKIFLTPFLMWKIILNRYKDKDLNKAANRAKLLIFAFFLSVMLEFILIIITTPNLNFRWA